MLTNVTIPHENQTKTIWRYTVFIAYLLSQRYHFILLLNDPSSLSSADHPRFLCNVLPVQNISFHFVWFTQYGCVVFVLSFHSKNYILHLCEQCCHLTQILAIVFVAKELLNFMLLGMCWINSLQLYFHIICCLIFIVYATLVQGQLLFLLNLVFLCNTSACFPQKRNLLVQYLFFAFVE